MKLQRTNKLPIVAICLLAVVYSVSSQCCDFSTTACSWSGAWLTSPVSSPYTTPYPYFWSTALSTNFKFVQNQPATEISDTLFYVSAGTVISFDYFFDSAYYSTENKLEFFFENAATGFTVLIAAVVNPNPSWNIGYSVACDNTNSFCCGVGDVPCQGRIRVTSSIDVLYPDALFAFDRIGTCGVIPPTTPSPSICCNFDSYDCTTSSSWTWSAVSNPAILPPPTGGYYIWTEKGGTQALFPTVTVPNTGYSFSFYYYIQSAAADITVTFFPTGYSPVSLGTLSYSTSKWLYATLPCNQCCDGISACTGQLAISTAQIGGIVVAVDNVLLNNACF
ncbi:hypothetical protein CHUAL_008324 [Chamberlinius hualienensis]